MSFGRPSSYDVAVKEMNYWKNRAENQNRGYDAWSDSSPRPYRSQGFDSIDDRMDMGPRNNATSSPYGSRLSTPSLKHLSSSNQINTSLFNNYQSGGVSRIDDSYPYTRRSPYRPPPAGRVTGNALTEFSRARRILQKRAMNSIGTGAIANTTTIKRRRGPRVRKPQTQTPAKTEVKKDEKSEKNGETPAAKSDKSAAELKIAITWVNDTKTNINREQTALIINKLEQLLDELPEEAHVPKFYASGLSLGAFKLVCADKESADWIKECVANFGELWEGANLIVIEQSEISGLVLVSLPLLDNDTEIISLLRRLERQNPEVKTDKWRLHLESNEGRQRTLVFGVDRESFDYIKKQDFKLFLGLRRVKFQQGVVKPNQSNQQN